jgi:hypothetical protein
MAPITVHVFGGLLNYTLHCKFGQHSAKKGYIPTTAQGGGFKFVVPFNTFKTVHFFEQLPAQRTSFCLPWAGFKFIIP